MLAGRLFGRILNRDADKGGYDYTLDCMQRGIKTVKELIVELITSDEYIDRFVLPMTCEDAVKHVHSILLGGAPDLEELPQAARHFARLGLANYVGEIVAAEEYERNTGPNQVP